MYKGKYFVVGSGPLRTETMVIFAPGVDVDNVSQLLESTAHDDRIVSWGEIEFGIRGPLDRQGELSVRCTPDNETDGRREHDTRLAKKTFGPYTNW